MDGRPERSGRRPAIHRGRCGAFSPLERGVRDFGSTRGKAFPKKICCKLPQPHEICQKSSKSPHQHLMSEPSFTSLIKNYFKKSKKRFAWLFIFVVTIIPLLPLPPAESEGQPTVNAENSGFVRLDNVRIIALGMLLVIILSIQFEIHEVVTRKKEKRIFDNFDDARASFEKIMHGAIWKNNPVEIKMLGVALAFSWPALRATLTKYYTKNKKLPSNIKIEFSILSRDWLRRNLDDANQLWMHRSELLFVELNSFIEIHKEDIVFNGADVVKNSKKQKFEITFSTYPYTPNYHGLLIEEKHMSGMAQTLFLSHCAWDAETLSAGENVYSLYQTGITEKEDLSRVIYQYESWFKYRNAQLSLNEFRLIAESLSKRV